MFGMLGPLNWLIDLTWLSSDANRQALRDKFAGTYVIHANALPAGTGRLGFCYYHILLYNFLFKEIEPVDGPRASAQSRSAAGKAQ